MKVLRNYMYNALYQILIIVLPIITVPYISRIFSPEQIGLNAYTYSIAQYFVLFAGLGVGLYGNRTIAYVKDNEKQRIKTFWSIFFTVLFFTIISISIYYIYVFVISRENFIIQIIQSLYIISVAIDVSWLFMGMEDFKKIVTRSTFVKIIGVIGIFTFVKSSDDIYIYILLLATMNMLGLITMWLYVPQYIKGFYFNISDIKSHIIPLIKIYIPQVAIQIYVIMDKTMIGVLSNEAEVGYYDMSQKIVKIILSIVTTLGVVMVPHISNLIANNKFDEVKKNIRITFSYMSYLAFPMAFGLSIVSRGLAVWFFGENFSYTGILMSYSSFIIIAITWSNIIGMQMLLPMLKEKEFTISVIFGAIVNVIINLILIPKCGAFGAIIATIVGEFTVTFVQIILVKKYINVIPFLFETWKSLLASFFMYLVVSFLTKNLNYAITTTLIQVFLGIVIYIMILILLRSQVQNDLIKKINLNLKFVRRKLSIFNK